ncbi:MAG: MBL fold metallo-hydrolase [Chloroflexota bacterium]
MEITWYGHSCFRITERNLATVVTDPFNHTEIGYSELKLKADIVTVSHTAQGHDFVKAVKGSDWEIIGPGEYEIGGVFLTGVATDKTDSKNDQPRNVVFVFDYNGLGVAHLGDIKSVPTRKQIEGFGNVDVLLVPVGAGGSLNAAKAAEVVSLIEPGIVIPMHYGTDASKIELKPLELFLKQMGLGNNIETQESLKIAKNSIPEETKVVVLDYKS